MFHIVINAEKFVAYFWQSQCAASVVVDGIICQLEYIKEGEQIIKTVVLHFGCFSEEEQYSFISFYMVVRIHL